MLATAFFKCALLWLFVHVQLRVSFCSLANPVPPTFLDPAQFSFAVPQTVTNNYAVSHMATFGNPYSGLGALANLGQSTLNPSADGSSVSQSPTVALLIQSLGPQKMELSCTVAEDWTTVCLGNTGLLSYSLAFNKGSDLTLQRSTKSSVYKAALVVATTVASSSPFFMKTVVLKSVPATATGRQQLDAETAAIKVLGKPQLFASGVLRQRKTTSAMAVRSTEKLYVMTEFLENYVTVLDLMKDALRGSECKTCGLSRDNEIQLVENLIESVGAQIGSLQQSGRSHNDVKPENVMVQVSEVTAVSQLADFVLIDFDLSTFLWDVASDCKGTRGFFSPIALCQCSHARCRNPAAKIDEALAKDESTRRFSCEGLGFGSVHFAADNKLIDRYSLGLSALSLALIRDTGLTEAVQTHLLQTAFGSSALQQECAHRCHIAPRLWPDFQSKDFVELYIEVAKCVACGMLDAAVNHPLADAIRPLLELQ